MVVCKYCNKEFKSKSDYHSNRNLNKHIIHCSCNPNRTNYFCKYCGLEEITPSRIASHVSTCKLNPNYEKIISSKIESGKIGRPHSKETKDKISRVRKEYLKNNPDKVPYLINHSRKESYPEKYFTEIFKKENLNVVKAYRVGLYELDFAIPDRKIDIEIDGSQHYYDKRIVESDIRRNKFLEDNGWDIIRIEWSKYQKMRKIEKLDYIQNLKSYIDNLLVTKPLIMVEDIKRRKNKSTCVCGSEKEIKSRTCNKCRGLKDRKVERPSYEELIKEVSELGTCRKLVLRFNI